MASLLEHDGERIFECHLLPGSEYEAVARLDAYFAQTVAHPEQAAA